MQQSSNTHVFDICPFFPTQTHVKQSLLSASADAPESILDAMMQLAVCEVSGT